MDTDDLVRKALREAFIKQNQGISLLQLWPKILPSSSSPHVKADVWHALLAKSSYINFRSGGVLYNPLDPAIFTWEKAKSMDLEILARQDRRMALFGIIRHDTTIPNIIKYDFDIIVAALKFDTADRVRHNVRNNTLIGFDWCERLLKHLSKSIQVSYTEIGYLSENMFEYFMRYRVTVSKINCPDIDDFGFQAWDHENSEYEKVLYRMCHHIWGRRAS